MIDFLIIEDETIEGAVSKALDQLNADINEVEIEIIQEPGKGFLGINSKNAKVKVSIVDGPKQKAEKYLKMLFQEMKIDCRYDVDYTGQKLDIRVFEIGDLDKGIVIGKKGNTLDAIQFVLSLIVNKNRNGYVRTFINIEDYREKREETLIKLAHKTADRARMENGKIHLEPMNPYERRIIHSALQGEEDIITYSEGEDPYRRIIVDIK